MPDTDRDKLRALAEACPKGVRTRHGYVSCIRCRLYEDERCSSGHRPENCTAFVEVGDRSCQEWFTSSPHRNCPTCPEWDKVTSPRCPHEQGHDVHEEAAR